MPDETGPTAAGFLARAHAHFAGRGFAAERVLTDNGSPFVSRAWRAACAALAVRPNRTRPRRPQTNGKVERFHRTLAEEWAYVRAYPSQQARTDALAPLLHAYNHHRCHAALGGQPPVSRVNNLSGRYS